MYTVLGVDRTLRAFLGIYAIVVALVAVAIAPPTSAFTVIRWALVSVGLLMTFSWVVAGWSYFYAPWRCAFRWWPALNKWIYPDLNGVWYGTTRSNWQVVEALRDAATGQQAVDLEFLKKFDLREGEIAMEVKANLFRISVKSKASATGGSSFTLLSRAEKSADDHDNYQLSYLYRQDTPEPTATDEESHTGAATLQIEFVEPLSMRGVYWTRRKWREGMNTAGKIEVRRVSDRHTPQGVDLLQHARKLATS